MKVDLPSRTAVIIDGFEVMNVISESHTYVLYRAKRDRDGVEIALKTLVDEYPLEEDVNRIRREFHLVQRLEIEGVIQFNSLISFGHGNLAIEMELFGLSLDQTMMFREGGAMTLDGFFPLALKLSDTLGEIHEKCVVHKDVNPRNILIDPKSGEMRLTDFGFASELDRERQDQILAKRLEGSLPYISPEQTGRINRDLDYRSDYYSLGVTFFQLLTGELPIEAKDALEWVHGHISKTPKLAHTLNPQVPPAISAIIAKLMAKNAEDRYQSSFGLATDLRTCQQNYKNGKLEKLFQPGTFDLSRRFRVSHKLYGRQAEIQQLESHVDDVARGPVGFCLVSGYSGVGKSALVNELSKHIVRKKGYLVQGKFDQFQQSSPYMALGLAINSIIQHILGQSSQHLEYWKNRFSVALENHGQLLIDIVPELEIIIGPQPAMMDLPPTEAQNRFQLAFLSFIKALASNDHPLFLFMDDLQWSDTPTLHLIQRIVTAHDLKYVFVIGAYRDNAVDLAHPLMLVLGEIEKERMVSKLHLKPLDFDAINMITADTLCCKKESCRHLSDIIYRKTKGNPFFTIEFLKGLHDDGVVFFDAKTGRWDWDEEKAKEAEDGDNVVDFLVASQRRLKSETQQVLQLAACIGGSFDLKTLAMIHESSLEKTASELVEAIEKHLIIPLKENYKFVGLSESGERRKSELNPAYKFQHDRVQQAAYSLIDPKKQQTVHLSIGRLMLNQSTEEVLAERLIDVVVHLNKGRELIKAPDERLELVRLNLAAGKKAKSSSAYASAILFLKVSEEFLCEKAWTLHYDLSLSIAQEIQHCCYLTGEQDEADRWTDVILHNVHTPLEKAKALSARTRQYATIGKMVASIQAAQQGLQLLGFNLTETPNQDTVDEEIDHINRLKGGRDVTELINEPLLTDPNAKIASQLLMEVFPAAFLSGSGDMFSYLVLKSAHVALQYGRSPETAFAYASYGMLLCGVLDDPALGNQYGKLGVNMIEQFDDLALRSRIIYVYTMFTHHWCHHWSTMTPLFRRGIEAGYQSGDLLYLAYSAQDCIIWDPKLNLEVASKEHRQLLTIVKDCDYQDSYDSGSLFLQMQLNFQGLTESTFSMTDENFDEVARVRGMLERKFMTGIANYHIYKAEIHFFYNDVDGAMEHVLKQEQLMASAMSLPQIVRFSIIAFLTRSALYPFQVAEEKSSSMEFMQSYLMRMKRWTKLCRENAEHLLMLMEAKLSELNGEIQLALRYFERAIALSKASGFLRDEAMANELAGQCLLNHGLSKASEGYLQAAHYLYYRWGAHRKVTSLEQKHPHLFNGRLWQDRSGQTTVSRSSGTIESEALDMSSVFRASQAISEELVLSKLWTTTLEILIENAGAQRGLLVQSQDGDLVIQAHWGMGYDELPLPQVIDDTHSMAPTSVINMAIRTGKPLVIGNATEEVNFKQDPYVLEHLPKSVMCVPLPRHGHFKIAIYLENNLTHSVFAKDRVKVVQLLAAQAAISLENARIYEEQACLLNAQQHFVPIQFLKHLGHQDITKVKLGESVSMEMSVLFSDLRDFTPLVETLEANLVIDLLNRYFGEMGIPINEGGGFIDSYNGDEIMALFGVSPQQAVITGIKMRAALERFNAESVLRNQPRLFMGMGLNTGPLVMGTMGSKDRMKCSVVGDTVNLASRIEQLTKTYRAQFLIGEQTYERLSDPSAFSIRMIDQVAVKGKEKAIKLYEVLDSETPERKRLKEQTKAMLAEGQRAYYDGQFQEALVIFEELLCIDPEDLVLSTYRDRSQSYLKALPLKNWCGFEKLNKK